jgi:hypothetical protein
VAVICSNLKPPTRMARSPPWGTTLRFASDLARKNETTRRIARAVAGLIVREVSDIDSYIDLVRYETRTLLTTHADTSASDKISFSH